jgi:hypothetical protein
VAFPAQDTNGKALELFIAQVDGQKVRPVTDKGWMIKEYVWIKDDTILVTFQRPSGRLQQWQATLDTGAVVMEKIP